MRVRRVATAIVVLFSASFGVVGEEQNYNEIGRKGYAAWRCAVFAEIMKNREEQSRLFTLGYDLLRELVDARFKGKLTKENTADVPVGILWFWAGGLTVDFTVGHLWAQVSEDAYKKVFPLEASKSFNESTKRTLARSEYDAENCSLIK